MGRTVIQCVCGRISAFVLCAALLLLLPEHTLAWGRNGHRLVVNKAIDTLPPEFRGFFESSRGLLLHHVTDPLDAIAKSPAERPNHFSLLHKYEPIPFDALPPNYNTALTN